MNKWSKGPWHSDFADIYSDDGRLVATVRERRMKGGCPDTRLIEAAPDLAEALEEMLAAHSMESIGVDASLRRTNAKQAARAALAKARGEA